MNLQSIIEAILNEEIALTKGSQRVMGDKNLVANLADSIRDDARSHPSAFPAGFNRTCQKTPDPQLAQWFLENIDKIEKEGYDGIVYSRDGVNSDWIVRRYIAGSHNWEDLTGVMNMNLCDWYLLKNRHMLDPNHKDLPKFGSVRDVGYYMTTHYKDKLEKLRDASKNAARNKMAKSVKLVDNDDYRIYTTLNRAAGCALGLGTQWCTANSSSGNFFHSYSKNAMLFQVFPYVKEKDKEGNLVNVKDEDGKKEMNEVEKYQFDAGGPNFMDVTDRPAKPDVIREKFPYMYTDLAAALKEKKPAMEKAFADLSADPTLQGDDFKINSYEIDEEIKKLHKFVDRGYFTDEVRKKDKVEKDDAGQEQPQLGPPAEPQAPQEQPQMESIRELARMMLEGKDIDEEELDEDELDDTGITPPSAAGADTGGDLGSMGGGAGPTGGGKYPPGTAPSMPESLNYKGNEIMENVDKDVAAMMKSLKKYDMLVESCAPVLMARPKPYVGEGWDEDQAKKEKLKAPPEEVNIEEEKDEVEESGKPWEADKEEDKKDKKPGDKTKTHKGGEVTKTEKGLVHKGTYGDDKKKDKVEETADPEVLAWMARFSKLGNMKGYGR